MNLPWVRRSEYEAVLDALKLAIIYIDTLPIDPEQVSRRQRIIETARRRT